MAAKESQFMTNREMTREMYGDVKLVKENVGELKDRLSSVLQLTNEHQGKIAAIETAVLAFKVESGKLELIGKASLGVVALFGTITGGIIVALIVHFFIRI